MVGVGVGVGEQAPASPLNTPAQSTSPRSPPTSLQTTLARSATSLLRHPTMTTSAISHFHMLEVDYFYDRYLVFRAISRGEIDRLHGEESVITIIPQNCFDDRVS